MFSPEILYNISYGLYVISARDGEKLNGFVSNTVMQVTSSPVQIATMVSKNNFTCAMIEKSKMFTVSILSDNISKEAISAFGYKSGRDINKFETFAFESDSRNVPYLTDGVLAFVSCNVVNTIDFGTHFMFVGEVVEGGDISKGKALTYADYRIKFKAASPKNAPTYQQKPNQIKMEKETYVCDLCGYVYDPEVGDPDGGIAPGTPFEDIPSTWVCPICGVDKSHFTKQ